MPRWGMVIDLDKCFACQSCTAACRMENNTPIAPPEESDRIERHPRGISEERVEIDRLR